MVKSMRSVLSQSLLIILLTCIYGCGIYTFNGSTLPSYIKTVDIPLFSNNSLEPGIADEITQELSKRIVSDNQLRVVSDRGDATIFGEITAYNSEPYIYGATAAREVDVEQYIVRITAKIEFIDNKKDKPLFEGSVLGEGTYDFKIDNEKIGRDKAKQEIVQKVLEKSIQSW